MSEPVNLAPCPFCGKPATVSRGILDYVGCLPCYMYFSFSPNAEFEEKAVAAWNARAESAELVRLRAENGRLREAIRVCVDDAREIATHGDDDNPCDHETINGCRSHVTETAAGLHNLLVEALQPTAE